MNSFGRRKIAYFSMEIALSDEMATYSGGLGVLAGDTVLSAADQGVPLVAVTLAYRNGYFRQTLDEFGNQAEAPDAWPLEECLQDTGLRIPVEVEGRTVVVRPWLYSVRGASGETVPVYLLDSDLDGNHPSDREITHWLYGGDERYRLKQEVLLGFGGVRTLRALGYQHISRFHMNEGHASLLGIELLREIKETAGRETIAPDDIEKVRDWCVFTTHTPVPSGHDQFSMDLVGSVIRTEDLCHVMGELCHEGRLNMTYLALKLSGYVNGVAKRHGEISQIMYTPYEVHAITNGVHVGRWTCPSHAALYERYLPGWRSDPFSLRYARTIPLEELWDAHVLAKKALVSLVKERTGVSLDPDAFTIGFARRATSYKRADLVFSDLSRLQKIREHCGPLQFVFAGKAHPRDEGGKEMIRRVFGAASELRESIPVVYIPEYEMKEARALTAGCDLWLNTPLPPQEASGTSGMKAAVNGVPSLSVLDGWWIEGCIEDLTGWGIAEQPEAGDDRRKTAAKLYDKLESVIMPMFYRDPDQYRAIMRHAASLNGSFFTAHRMLQEYVLKAYL